MSDKLDDELTQICNAIHSGDTNRVPSSGAAVRQIKMAFNRHGWKAPDPKFGTLAEYGTPVEVELVTSKEFMAHATEAGKNRKEATAEAFLEPISREPAPKKRGRPPKGKK